MSESAEQKIVEATTPVEETAKQTEAPEATQSQTQPEEAPIKTEAAASVLELRA